MAYAWSDEERRAGICALCFFGIAGFWKYPGAHFPGLHTRTHVKVSWEQAGLGWWEMSCSQVQTDRHSSAWRK